MNIFIAVSVAYCDMQILCCDKSHAEIRSVIQTASWLAVDIYCVTKKLDV